MPDWALCDGLGTRADASSDHCCYIEGQPCPYLQVNGPTGRRFACALRAELGDWALVHQDPRYLADVKPHWVERGVTDCGPWMGCNKATFDAAIARGSITEAEFTQYAQCCFRRVWCATPQKASQAVRAINRTL